jgi:endonuclease I
MKMKLFLLTAIAACMQFLGYSQAALPAFWNFDVATPNGWTESLGTNGNTRYATGFAGQACKLDATGEYVLLEFAEEPGLVTYYMKGQNSGGAFQGTFTVEESADGNNFTTLHQYVNADLATAAFTQYSNQPLPTTRYIRWYYTEKISGHNVGLDEINLAVPGITAAQEINVTGGGNNIPSGFDFVMAGTTQSSITIENLGTGNTLNIAGIAISGTNAAEFSLGTIPTSIAPSSSASLTINFAPTFSGSHFCTLTITSDDASEPSYEVHVYAISGNTASEPTQSAQNVIFTNVRAWDVKTRITESAQPAERYLVLRKKGAPVSQAPVDGTTYVKGQWLGDAQVVAIINSGDTTSFDARGIESGFTYHVAVYAFNGPAGYENYLTSSALTDTFDTPAPNFGSLYNTLDTNSPNFVTDLTSVMNPSNYFQIYYSNYIATLVNNFYIRDTVVNGQSKSMVECQYSGVPYIFDASFQWTDLSREHSFPQSWMPSYFDTGFDDSPEVSDLHNLVPVWQNQVNAVRSNYPYGEVTTPTSGQTVNGTSVDCALGTNAGGQTVYEMRDSFKGNAARAMMYQAVKYNAAGADFSFPEQISLTIPYGQSERIIKQWHFQDLPDSWEITRNEYNQYEQHNRNAFIDQVTYPCFIRFSSLQPFVPQVINSGDSLLTCTDFALSYQWYLNGSEIPNANAASLAMTEPGEYAVQLQQFQQCPTFTSPAVTIGQVSITENDKNRFGMSVYPNPNSGEFTLTTELKNATDAVVKIYDISGKVVYSKSASLPQGVRNQNLDLNLQSGVYFIEVSAAHGAQRERLIVK